MVWYQYLDRTKPYLKNYRRWNMWYDFNNAKNCDIKRTKVPFIEHYYKRIMKHDAFARYFHVFVTFPFFLWVWSIRKRFVVKKVVPEESFFSGSQYVAQIGRNQYGFETRATKSFEMALSVLIGKDILGHILDLDKDPFRAEHLADVDTGLAGDMSEEDVLDLMKQGDKHSPHLGVVLKHPDKHYLNDKPNDLLSPYKVVGEKLHKKQEHHEQEQEHGKHNTHH